MISGKAPNEYFSSTYLSEIIQLFNRICIHDFEFFSKVLNEFLSEKNISFNYVLEIWLSKMEQIISVETR